MTFQEIIKNCPTTDYSSIYVFIGEDCVWDYKERDKSIMLISDQPCIDDEKVTLAELINYSKELETPEDFLTLECEYERQELKSFEWLENKLILSF